MSMPLALPRDCGTRLLQTVNHARPVGDCTGRGPRNPLCGALSNGLLHQLLRRLRLAMGGWFTQTRRCF